MASIKDRLTCRNLLNIVVRLPLATFLVHNFSHWLFSQLRAQQLLHAFTTSPQLQYPDRAMRDLATIQKLFKFWPPHQGSGYGEFSLAFTISLVLFLRLIDIPTVLRFIFGYTKNSIVLNFLLTPIYAAIIPFVMLLPMMRLAEMHFLVLILNFLHIWGCSTIVYTVWYLLKYQKSSDKLETEKSKTD